MKRAIAAASLLGLAACSQVGVRARPDQMTPAPPVRAATGVEPVADVTETKSEHGPVLVIERRGDTHANGMRIIVDDAKDWELVRGLVEAVHGPSASPMPPIQTVDDFLSERRADKVKNEPETNLEKLRKELLNDLKGHRAVVYRYIATNQP